MKGMQTKKTSPSTARKRISHRLTLLKNGAGEGMFQSIVDLGTDGILVYDEQYRILYANRMVTEITGYARPELLEMSALSLFGRSNQPFLEGLLATTQPQGEKVYAKIPLPTSKGVTKEIDVCFILKETPQGNSRVYVYLGNSSDSRRTACRIREATREFEKIAEMGEDGIVVYDESSKIVYANQMASEITGRAKEDLIGRNFFTVIGKQNTEFLDGTVMRGEGMGEKFCTEVAMKTPTGQVKDTEVCIAQAKTDAGEARTYAYIRDMTTRKKFERDVKASEERLRNLFERVRHGLFISSKAGKFLDCNQALLEMLGYSSKKEFLNIDIAHDLYVNPGDRKLFQEKIEREGYVKDMEVEFKKRNGEKITVLLTGHPVKNERGEIIGYEGINLDITERKRIEDELREANEFFMNLIESSVDGIIAADMKGNIFIFNKGAEALTGYPGTEVIGKIHITDIYPEGIAREVMKKLRSPDFGGVGKLPPVQLTVVNREREKIPIQLSAALIYDREGREIASVGIFTDLRPRIVMEKKLEETHLQLVSSEKMASLGKLAAGIAHEINNPLGGILIYASLMMEDLPEEDLKRQDLARIVQETSRCKEIVKSLLEFARQTEPKIEPTDINRAITDGLFFLENQALFHNIRIIKNLDPLLPFVRGNAGQLKQVFMNIIVNAAEAMPGSGTLTITTSPSPDRKAVVVEFTDTGEGIPEQNLTRIFDPFFTTKDVGKGTGLGLATSYGIVEGHGGKIGVRSKVGEGTTFLIDLPVHPEVQPFEENSSSGGKR